MKFIFYDHYNIVLFEESLHEQILMYLKQASRIIDDQGIVSFIDNDFLAVGVNQETSKKSSEKLNDVDLFKYISYGNPESKSFIMFDMNNVHSEMARRFSLRPLTAGFVKPSNLNCFGESFSLNISSRADDSELLKRLF